MKLIEVLEQKMQKMAMESCEQFLQKQGQELSEVEIPESMVEAKYEEMVDSLAVSLSRMSRNREHY